jgi:hypothetical protein
MPALKNPRHERLAQLFFAGLADGITQEQAYAAAGYQVRNKVARKANASRLMQTIANRVRELQAEALERQKTKIDLSRERVGARLDKASRIAEEERNASAMATSELGIAKVFGHITDKHEDVTPTQAYANAQSQDDIGRELLRNVGHADASDAEIAAALAAQDVFIAALEAIAHKAAGEATN